MWGEQSVNLSVSYLLCVYDQDMFFYKQFKNPTFKNMLIPHPYTSTTSTSTPHLPRENSPACTPHLLSQRRFVWCWDRRRGNNRYSHPGSIYMVFVQQLLASAGPANN